MKFTLKSFKKRAYLFTPEQLNSKEAFKTAVHEALDTTWLNNSDEETPAEVIEKVKGWLVKIDEAIDNATFPLDENNLDVLWMESSDVWDDIEHGFYNSVDDLFNGFVKSIAGEYEASSDVMSEKIPLGNDFQVAGTETTKCVDCDTSLPLDKMVKNDEGAGYICPGCAEKRQKEDHQASEGGEKKYNYTCDTCGKPFVCYQCLPRPMARVCDTCEDSVPSQSGNDFYDAKTRTAKFKLKSYKAGSRGIFDYKPEFDAVGDFYVVTSATADSELLDVYFQCNIGNIMLQSRGGLELSEIKGIYKDSDEAMLHAQRLIDTAKNSLN